MFSVDAPDACSAIAEADVLAELLSGFWQEVIPGEPPVPADEVGAKIGHPSRFRRPRIVVVREGAEVVGAAELVLEDFEGMSHAGEIDFLVVRPDRRKAGVGQALLGAIEEIGRAEGRTLLTHTVACSHAAAARFAAAAGAAPGLVHRQNRLRVSDLEPVVLDGWVRRAAERAGDYSLVAFDGGCPEDLLEAFAHVISVMNGAPRSQSLGEVSVTPEQVRANKAAFALQGKQGWTICARHEPTGQLVGFTEMGFSPYRPWLAEQGDTGVDSAHRHRGLGRWMKAANALRLLHERPEVREVETWNAGVNRAMLSINEAMGFRPVAEWQDWELRL
jgi:mycothiol synthase